MSQTLMSRPATHIAPELAERCDRCGMAGKLSVMLTAGGDLAFCGHHANRYAETILVIADRVIIESGFAWRGGSI